ncbi:MAG: hypothetical protein IJ945_02955 [Oscillospiraceae bacterium]|nr:hypothetical protein [Oscillospiraceae bacterium]
MKMKIFSCVFAALLYVFLCSCSGETPKPVLPSEPESIPEESVPTEEEPVSAEEENLLYGYVSADEISEEAKKDKEYFDRFIENGPYPERPYGYLYVVDEKRRTGYESPGF